MRTVRHLEALVESKGRRVAMAQERVTKCREVFEAARQEHQSARAAVTEARRAAKASKPAKAKPPATSATTKSGTRSEEE